MVISMACLGVATAFSIALSRYQVRRTHGHSAVIGGSVWEGAVRVARSPYLLLACLLMLLHNLTSTFLYNGLAVLVDERISGFEQRTIFFGYGDLNVQVLAFILQFFVTSRLVTAVIPEGEPFGFAG